MLNVEGFQKKQLKRLFNWNLDYVKAKMQKENPAYSDEYLSDLEIEYKRFISLNIYFPDSTRSPSNQVDDMWHTHILFTRNYFEFCEAIGVSYIHHNPFTGSEKPDETAKLFKNSIKQYEKIYGRMTEPYWISGGVCQDGDTGEMRCSTECH